MKNILSLSTIIVFVLSLQIKTIAQEHIVDRYNVYGGRGAETSRTLIGDISHKTPILYYLSYNACHDEDIWMIHCILCTIYPVEIPHPAKVLIKTFENKTIELTVDNSENGTDLETRYLNNKPLKRYNSEVHCIVSYEQLLQILKEGVLKIRIQTVLPNGYIERKYDNNNVARSLKNAHDILLNELKPIDIYEGF